MACNLEEDAANSDVGEGDHGSSPAEAAQARDAGEHATREQALYTANLMKIRMFQAGSVAAGLAAAIIQTFGHRMGLESGGVHSIEVRLAHTSVIGTTGAITWLWPWATAYPPKTPEAAKRDRLALILCTVAWMAACAIPEDRGLGKGAQLVRAITMHIVIFFFGTTYRYRNEFGGLRRLVDSPFGILVCVMWLTAGLYYGTLHNLFFLLTLSILVLMIVPCVMLAHPKFACSRRRCCGGGTPDKMSRDGAYVCLLMICTVGIPYAAGNILLLFYGKVSAAGGMATIVTVSVWQVLMVMLTMFWKGMIHGSMPEEHAVPFLCSILLVADAFLNLIFMQVDIKDYSFWVLLAFDFFLLVMRDADLWGDVVNMAAKSKQTAAGIADKAVSMGRVPDQVSSLLVIVELTSTVSLIGVILFEICMDALGVGQSAVTLGMTQNECLGAIGVFGIILSMQVAAAIVAHMINNYKKKGEKAAKGEEQVNAEVKMSVGAMWKAHGVYVMASTITVMANMVQGGVKLNIELDSTS